MRPSAARRSATSAIRLFTRRRQPGPVSPTPRRSAGAATSPSPAARKHASAPSSQTGPAAEALADPTRRSGHRSASSRGTPRPTAPSPGRASAGSAASCRVLLPIARKSTLAAPTSASATSSSGSVGASAARQITTPKPTRTMTSGRGPVRPRGGHDETADDRADAHRRGHEAERLAAAVEASRARRPAASPGTRRRACRRGPSSAAGSRAPGVRRDVAEAVAQLALAARRGHARLQRGEVQLTSEAPPRRS